MPFPPQYFDEAATKFDKRVRGHSRLGQWRKKIAQRDGLRSHLDRGWEFLLVHEPALETAAQRNIAAETIANYLHNCANDDESERFGVVPIWVFAIILKVIASVLIDMWLVRAAE